MSLQIRRLSYNLGAEITGIDIRKPIDDKRFREIHSAFLEHSVLLFRGQPLTRQQHIAFTRLFGEIDKNDKLVRDRDGPKTDPECPEILVTIPKTTEVFSPTRVREAKGKQWYAGMAWHSDRAFSLTPTMASLLRGVEVPEVGGDTMFTNLSLAYETLSDGMKKLIAGLYCIFPKGEGYVDFSTPERLAESKRLNPDVAQPLVYVHPETGRKALFIGERVKQFAGMTVDESEPLARFLFNHATRPQFVYRHSWHQHDLLMWDNRCTLHIAVGDYDRTKTRHMEKTAVKGTPSGGYAVPWT